MNKQLLTLLFLLPLFASTQNFSNNLLLYYPMNGSANDYSGNNFHGTVNGATLAPDRFGVPNSAYYFDGTNDYIDFPLSNTLKPSFPFTFSFWANLDAIGPQENRFFMTDFVQDNYHGAWMTAGGNGFLRIGFGGGLGGCNAQNGVAFIASNSPVSTGVWYRFTGVIHSANNMELYINCTNVNAVYNWGINTLNIDYSNSEPGTLGRLDNNTTQPPQYYQGFMDDFMYWDRALTQTEILSLCDSLPLSTQSWNCINEVCIDPLDGSGTYNDYNTCISNCTPPSPTWNCINYACIDPGDGSGTYNNYNTCISNCIPPSWNCVNGFCIDPGDGSGNYNSYNTCTDECIASNVTAFISGNDTICSNSTQEGKIEFSFSGGSPPYTFVYAIDGISQPSITTSSNPYVINSKKEGRYNLIYVSDIDGFGSTSGQAFITVKQAPKAEFSTLTDTLSILNPGLQLNDVSAGNITNWQWDFGDNSALDYTSNPYHVFEDSIGIYQISLIVKDNFGCSDTTFKQLWVTDEYWMYIPNSFTPDLDGINDVFCIYHNGVREETFLFNVYDRFSELVYATSNISELECFLNSNGWNGKHYETGTELPMGTYVYEVYFQDFEGWKHHERGHLFIIR
jgi:gliding motility-associated-like protein